MTRPPWFFGRAASMGLVGMPLIFHIQGQTPLLLLRKMVLSILAPAAYWQLLRHPFQNLLQLAQFLAVTGPVALALQGGCLLIDAHRFLGQRGR